MQKKKVCMCLSACVPAQGSLSFSSCLTPATIHSAGRREAWLQLGIQASALSGVTQPTMPLSVFTCGQFFSQEHHTGCFQDVYLLFEPFQKVLEHPNVIKVCELQPQAIVFSAENRGMNQAQMLHFTDKKNGGNKTLIGQSEYDKVNWQRPLLAVPGLPTPGCLVTRVLSFTAWNVFSHTC